MFYIWTHTFYVISLIRLWLMDIKINSFFRGSNFYLNICYCASLFKSCYKCNRDEKITLWLLDYESTVIHQGYFRNLRFSKISQKWSYWSCQIQFYHKNVIFWSVLTFLKILKWKNLYVDHYSQENSIFSFL